VRLIVEGTGHHHATNAQRGYCLGPGATIMFVSVEASLQEADHGEKHSLKCLPGFCTAACDVRRQGHHGAGIFNVFEVLAGQIGTNDLRANVGTGEVHLNAFPAVLPIGIRKETVHRFAVQTALASEVRIKATVRQAGTLHDVSNRRTFKTLPIELSPSAVDNPFSHFVTMSCGVWHDGLLEPLRLWNGAGKLLYILNIF
jgi:hypothetical protein